MKIAELITESQVTDEGVLGSIAKGAGTAIGAVGKGLGAISGAWKGAKDQFQKGQAVGRAHVGGWMPQQPKDTSVRDQEFARLTGKGKAAAPAAGGAQAGAAAGQDLAAQIKAKEAELADLKAQQKAASAQQEPTPLATPPKTEPGIGQASNGNNAAATNTAPADTKAPTPTVGGQPAPTAPSMKPMQTPGAGTNPNPTAAPAQQIVGKGGSKFDMNTGKPFADQAAADAQDDAIAAQKAAKAGAPAGQPNLQVQQGGKNPALDARKAALAQSKADREAGKGITGAIKTGTLGEELEEGFYSKFLGRML